MKSPDSRKKHMLKRSIFFEVSMTIFGCVMMRYVYIYTGAYKTLFNKSEA